MMLSLPAEVALFTDLGFFILLAGANAQATLMRGFTTVRDLGGPAFGLKRAIDLVIMKDGQIFKNLPGK